MKKNRFSNHNSRRRTQRPPNVEGLFAKFSDGAPSDDFAFTQYEKRMIQDGPEQRPSKSRTADPTRRRAQAYPNAYRRSTQAARRPEQGGRKGYPTRRRKRKLSAADRIIRALSVFLIVVLIIGIFLFAVWRYAIGEAKTGVTDSTMIVTNEVGETLSTSSAPVTIRDGQIINILLMGMDFAGTGEVTGRSDTMMLVTLDQKRNVVKLTSFQRDMLVYLPGTNTPVKLNSASRAGPFRLIETLNNTFHLDIRDYIQFDIKGAEEIIDAVGGVDVVLPEDEAVLEYLRRLITEQNAALEGWDDRTNWVDNIWEGGPVHLNGRQAVAYSRMRELDTDFARMDRQQEIISKVFSKAKNAGVSTLLELIRAGMRHVETNMTDAELTQMGINLIPKLSSEVKRLTVPIDGYFWMDARETWVIRANFNEIIPILHRFIYEEEIGTFTSVRLVPYTPLAFTDEEDLPQAVLEGWYTRIPYTGPNGQAGGVLLDSNAMRKNTQTPTATQAQLPSRSLPAVSQVPPLTSGLPPDPSTTPSTLPLTTPSIPSTQYTTPSVPRTTPVVPTESRMTFPVPPRN